MRKLAIALSTVALGFSGTAFAQNANHMNHAMPQGDMTRAQAQTRAEAMFAKMDANQDGTLNQADRAARKGEMFDKMDTDRNGSISRAEFDAMHAARAAGGGHEMAGEDGDHTMAHGGKMMGGHHGMMMGGHGMMMADGPVTRQAFVARALTMFDKADTNHNGTVTPTERKTAMDAMRGAWKAKAAARHQG